MAVIKHRQPGAAPQIIYSDIYIPDNQDLGTGKYSVFLKSNSLSKEEISSLVVNSQLNFQISVNFNPNIKKVSVLLGKVKENQPRSKKVYVLPDNLNDSLEHEFVATFENWQIKSFQMDNIPLGET